jgi:hypothetical protein
LAPLPPADIAARTPAIEELPADATIHRFFSKSDPNGGYGVLYAAKDRRGAFAETFLREPGRTLLASDFLAKKGYVRLATTRLLRLIRFAGAGLALLGATAEVVHAGPPYGNPQTWSAALHSHAVNADGIAHYARHDDEALCYAIFDRAASAIREVNRDTALNANWFWEIAEIYGVGLAP